MHRPQETHMKGIKEARAIWIDDLEEFCPAPHPVKVIWSPPSAAELKTCYGNCGLEGPVGSEYFEIRVDRSLPRTLQCHMLAHEWAHAVSWYDVPENQPHGHAWGVAYRLCYQAAVDL